jgi:putative FmdB family regulatory protein
MPAYDFKCTACNEVFEITRPAGATASVSCPACESAARRVFTPIGVHFKGSGFYNTDRQTALTPAAVAPPASSDSASAPADKPESTPAPACPASTGGSCASCPAAASE